MIVETLDSSSSSTDPWRGLCHDRWTGFPLRLRSVDKSTTVVLEARSQVRSEPLHLCSVLHDNCQPHIVTFVALLNRLLIWWIPLKSTMVSMIGYFDLCRCRTFVASAWPCRSTILFEAYDTCGLSLAVMVVLQIYIIILLVN